MSQDTWRGGSSRPEHNAGTWHLTLREEKKGSAEVVSPSDHPTYRHNWVINTTGQRKMQACTMRHSKPTLRATWGSKFLNAFPAERQNSRPTRPAIYWSNIRRWRRESQVFKCWIHVLSGDTFQRCCLPISRLKLGERQGAHSIGRGRGFLRSSHYLSRLLMKL